MKKISLATFVLTLLLSACAVVPVGPPGREKVMFIPILPPIVVLGAEPYYYHQGYHYHYRGSRWYYSRSRSGPWLDLPRDHYPKELRFKDRGGHHPRGRY